MKILFGDCFVLCIESISDCFCSDCELVNKFFVFEKVVFIVSCVRREVYVFGCYYLMNMSFNMKSFSGCIFNKDKRVVDSFFFDGRLILFLY